jgi:hypothetical protein
MTDLRTLLHAALGNEEDERLTPDEAAAMRRVVIGAARESAGESPRIWFAPLAVAATVVAMVAVGVAIGGRFDATATRAVPNDVDAPATQTPDRARQLQFSTPGGTRIIWILNSDLNLKTTP